MASELTALLVTYKLSVANIPLMRLARLLLPDALAPGGAYRVNDRRFIFGDEEKQVLLGLVRRDERFCGVRVLTFCLMSNHFDSQASAA